MKNNLDRYKEFTREEKANFESYMIYRDIDDVLVDYKTTLTDEEKDNLKEIVLNYYNEESICNYPLTHSCQVITKAYLNKEITMEELKEASFDELYNAIDGRGFYFLSTKNEMER